ncbi:MAG: hypothetical protein IJZ10_12275, partial [Thermoguttaceae bacterium]|nr:hypothetical protein [Thermoguttaceae bacterium]
FDAAVDLATPEELAAEGIDRAPISCSIYYATGSLAPYSASTTSAEPVPGFENLEIDPSAFVEPDAVEANGFGYNFRYSPPSRASFPFEKPGVYFVDFLIYPKTGAALAFRIGAEVK